MSPYYVSSSVYNLLSNMLDSHNKNSSNQAKCDTIKKMEEIKILLRDAIDDANFQSKAKYYFDD